MSDPEANAANSYDDTPFNERIWVNDAVDLANLILESPLSSDRSTDERRLRDADWPHPTVNLSFNLARFDSDGGHGYRLRAENTAAEAIDEYHFYSDNHRPIELARYRSGRHKAVAMSVKTRQQQSQKITEYLMFADVDREDFFAVMGANVIAAAEAESLVESISRDPRVELEISSRPDRDSGRIKRDVARNYYSTVEALSTDYNTTDEVVKKGIERHEARLEQERFERGQA